MLFTEIGDGYVGNFLCRFYKEIHATDSKLLLRCIFDLNRNC